MTAPTRTTPRLTPLLLAWLLLLVIETLGQVAMEHAGMRVGALQLDRASLGLALSSPGLWVGVVCYLAQFAIWMTILEKSALSRAFPVTAIVFVAVMVASWAVFGDPMGWEKLLGSVIIVSGILLLGGETHPSSTPAIDPPGSPS